MTSAPGRRARALLLLAAALPAAPLLPALAAGEALYFRDVGQNHLPNRILGLRMIRDGEPPLWNPLRGAGQPFLANPNSMVLRPTTLLFLIFPERLVHVPVILSVMLLLAAAGAGTWAYLRACGRSEAAALVGAAAFALSGPVQTVGQILNYLEGVAWMPATLWLVRRGIERGWRPWGVLAGGAFGLVLAAGEPVFAAVTLTAAAAVPGLRGCGPRRAAALLAAVLATGLLISAVQVLPMAEIAARSLRAEGLDLAEVLRWSLPPRALAEAAVPGLLGDPSRAGPGVYWGGGLHDTGLPLLLSIHLGAPILVLAAAGVRGRGAEGGAAPALLAAAGLLLALGRFTPIYGAAAGLPGLAAVRYPVKWYYLTAWCAAVLAAAGWDRLASGPPEGRAGALLRRAAGAAAAAGILAGLAAWSGLAGAAVPAVRAVLAVPAVIPDEALALGAIPSIGKGLALACSGVLAVVVLLPRAGGGPRAWTAAAACGALLLAGAWGLNPSAPPDLLFAPSPLARAMPEVAAGQARFFAFPRPRGFAYRNPAPEEAAEAGIPQDALAWGMRWDVRSLRNATYYGPGLRGAFDRHTDSRLDLLPGSEVARRLGEGIPLPEALRLLSAASVRYVLAYGDLDGPGLREVASLPGESNVPVRLYENAGALPRAYLVGRAVPVRDPWEAIEAVRTGSADPGREVLVEGAAGGEAPAPDGRLPGTAAIVVDRPLEVVVRVAAERPSWLVLSDTFDPSWRAAVDGTPADLLRAHGMFRAVRVPAGAREVRFTYRPASVVLAAALTALGLAGAAVIGAAGRRTARGGAAPRAAGPAG